MTNIIVVFPKLEDAKNLKNLLVRNGYPVAAVCTTGSQALHYADGFVNGVLLCAYKLPDMMYSEIKEYMPGGFDMILLANRKNLQDCGEVVSVAMPFAVRDLLNTLEMSILAVERRKKRLHHMPKERSKEDKKWIEAAKEVLMNRNHMTEEDAHKYLQKCSMDSGTNLVEASKMVLAMEEYRD